MIKTSIAEVSRVTGKSARHIRNLCKEGKLPCEKIKINTGEKYMIYLRTSGFKELFGDIPLNEFNEYEEDDIILKEVLPSLSDSLPPQEEDNSFLQEDSEEITSPRHAPADIEMSAQISSIVETLTQRIEFLAKEAGKTELLTDNLMSSNENVKFYQDEYFKIRHELEIRTAELEQANKKIEELQERLKKPFWKRF